ncbi:MAG: hypothetical protein ACJ75F_00905 [Flavisolibacter sp.]|jgi:hypothetical protein
MKRLFVTLAVVTLFTVNSFAADGISHKVPQSFYITFNGASKISTDVVNGLTRISFILDEQQHYAYYNASGELVVLTKQIGFDDLPRALRQDYKKTYNNYFISDVLEVSNDDVDEFYLVLKNGSEKVVLKSASDKWNVFREK